MVSPVTIKRILCPIDLVCHPPPGDLAVDRRARVRQAEPVTWTARSSGTYVTQLWMRRRWSAASYESHVNGSPVTVR